jgi:ppGpp synthetase/RelA/SpoT-type nucleotidyltranferase
MAQSIAEIYEATFPQLHEAAVELRAEIGAILKIASYPRIDKITARAKRIESFINKSKKIDPETDKPKYPKPLLEIQDQIGVRVVTFYPQDVAPVAEIILRDFSSIENRDVIADHPAKFGYEARHLICIIPEPVRRKFQPRVEFFEIQICTLFQHAWAEANHNLLYKPPRATTREEERMEAWAASQAWGADKVFGDLWDAFYGKPDKKQSSPN